MATCARPTAASTEAAPTATAADRRGPALLAWTALLLALVVGLPLFLRMPLFFDALHYDLCARKLLRGGVLYRDAFDNNLPGIIWIHAAVRAVFGWRPEALRLVDFISMALAVLLLLRWVPAEGGGYTPARVGTAAGLAFLYLFAPEFCHCQRDGWMLLPAVAALCLRDRQFRGVSEDASRATLFRRAVLEGLCWGAAFWIKPFVAVPALACWVVGTLTLQRGRRVILLDAGGLLAGGLLAGGLGLAWLVASGSWHSFWEILLGWDSEYAAVTYGSYPRHIALLLWIARFFPWSLVQVPAVVTALAAVARAVRGRVTANPTAPSRALLAAFYLGWLVQATLIQRSWDYVMITTLFPAVVLVAGAIQTEWRPFLRGRALFIFVVLAVIVAPGLRPERVAMWARCWQEGGTPERRDRLALNTGSGGAADWQDLARVAEFLRAQGVTDGELTCLGGCTHPLYLELDLEPSTRYHQVGAATVYFPSRAEQIRTELEASRSRYVVSDLVCLPLRDAPILKYQEAVQEVPGERLALPPTFPPEYLDIYPWCEELVFRSGRYVVHRVKGPVTKFWDYPPHPQ
jgi:hypothetical protein